jgi:hypothetical protein
MSLIDRRVVYRSGCGRDRLGRLVGFNRRYDFSDVFLRENRSERGLPDDTKFILLL